MTNHHNPGREKKWGVSLPEKQIYAGYYCRYDGKLIYVVTLAKDADTDEDMIIYAPATYADQHPYYTMTKASFCEQVIVGGVKQAKFKRRTDMKASEGLIEHFKSDGLRGPIRKRYAKEKADYELWRRPRANTYHEYAKQLCEGYRFNRAKYQLCVQERRYIGLTKEDFQWLKADLSFLQNCLKTVLKDYAGYFDERFIQGLSIRKYAEAHGLNRGSVDHIQRKLFHALAQALKERDEAEGTDRLVHNK